MVICSFHFLLTAVFSAMFFFRKVLFASWFKNRLITMIYNDISKTGGQSPTFLYRIAIAKFRNLFRCVLPIEFFIRRREGARRKKMN